MKKYRNIAFIIAGILFLWPLILSLPVLSFEISIIAFLTIGLPFFIFEEALLHRKMSTGINQGNVAFILKNTHNAGKKLNGLPSILSIMSFVLLYIVANYYLYRSLLKPTFIFFWDIQLGWFAYFH